METMTLKIKGLTPLLMHNGQLCDPMNEHTKAMSAAVKDAKKSKTEAAWKAAYRAEFMGGLYLDAKGEPCLTSDMIDSMIVEGARKTRQGKDAEISISSVPGTFALIYKGPRDPDKLWKSGAYHKVCGAKIGKARVMRCRPMFVDWSVVIDLMYDTDLVNPKDVLKFVEKAGMQVGIADWRPKYGRFEVVA